MKHTDLYQQFHELQRLFIQLWSLLMARMAECRMNLHKKLSSNEKLERCLSIMEHGAATIFHAAIWLGTLLGRLCRFILLWSMRLLADALRWSVQMLQSKN